MSLQGLFAPKLAGASQHAALVVVRVFQCGGAAWAGAGVAGGVHYLATAKALTEEGVDARARLHALPVAVRRKRQLCVCTVLPCWRSN